MVRFLQIRLAKVIFVKGLSKQTLLTASSLFQPSFFTMYRSQHVFGLFLVSVRATVTASEQARFSSLTQASLVAWKTAHTACLAMRMSHTLLVRITNGVKKTANIRTLKASANPRRWRK